MLCGGQGDAKAAGELVVTSAGHAALDLQLRATTLLRLVVADPSRPGAAVVATDTARDRAGRLAAFTIANDDCSASLALPAGAFAVEAASEDGRRARTDVVSAVEASAAAPGGTAQRREPMRLELPLR